MDLTLSNRKISSLGIFLGACLLLLATHTVSRTSWSNLFQDRAHSGVEIEEVNLLLRLPASNLDISQVLGQATPSDIKTITIHNDRALGLLDNRGERFTGQALAAFDNQLPVVELKGKPFVLFFDVPWKIFASIKDPTLVFGRLLGEWDLYANGLRVGSGAGRNGFNTITLRTIPKRVNVRFVVVIRNGHTRHLEGFDFHQGLSIRSSEEAAWASQTLPMQKVLPQVIAAVFFLCMAVFSVVLAVTTPKFTDLWALALFYAVICFSIWLDTPFYWESFEWNEWGSDSFLVAWSLGQMAIVLASCSLVLSYFRAKNFYGPVLVGMSIWCLIPVIVYWPIDSSLTPDEIKSAIGTHQLLALIGGMSITSLIGYSSLWRAYKRFKSEKLDAILPDLRRRFSEVAMFLLAIIGVQASYMIGLPMQSLTTGSEYFLLFSVGPAIVSFLQIYWTTHADTRLRRKLQPDLQYLDYLASKNLSSQRIYLNGVVAAFGVIGWKRLVALQTASPALKRSVDALFDRIATDLHSMVARDRALIRSRRTKGGWIITLFARDKKMAEEILIEMTNHWVAEIGRHLQRWRLELERIHKHAPSDLRLLDPSTLDLRVIMGTLDDITAESRGHQDFSSDKLTKLFTAYDGSRHNRIAMYRNEAELFMSQNTYAVLVESPVAHKSVGLLAIDQEALDAPDRILAAA